jgi:5-methylcytosine-specific restriction endonuclease McrA
VNEVSDSRSDAAKDAIIERIKSMVFLCMYCNSPKPVMISIIGIDYHASGAYATAYFICPDCRNKYMVKIQDLGKIVEK